MYVTEAPDVDNPFYLNPFLGHFIYLPFHLLFILHMILINHTLEKRSEIESWKELLHQKTRDGSICKPNEPRYWVMMISAILLGYLLVNYFDRIPKKKREIAKSLRSLYDFASRLYTSKPNLRSRLCIFSS